jgi:hypothetical protein
MRHRLVLFWRWMVPVLQIAACVALVYSAWERRKCFSEQCYLITESEIRTLVRTVLEADK